MSYSRIALIGSAIALAAAVSAQQTTPEPQATIASWRVPAGDPKRGEELAQTCLACHSTEAAGGGVNAPKLRRQRDSYLFFALLDYRDGRRTNELMAPFAADLTDQDARDLAVYLAGDFQPQPPKVHADNPGYAIAIRECTWCHGETGLGEYEGSPVLTGQDSAAMLNALKEYRSGVRDNETMRNVLKRIPESDDALLADYFASYSHLEYE